MGQRGGAWRSVRMRLEGKVAHGLDGILCWSPDLFILGAETASGDSMEYVGCSSSGH